MFSSYGTNPSSFTQLRRKLTRLDGRRHERRRDGEEARVEEPREVGGHLVRLLQADPQPVREEDRVGDHVVVADLGVLKVDGVQVHAVRRQEVHEDVGDPHVVLLLDELVQEHIRFRLNTEEMVQLL